MFFTLMLGAPGSLSTPPKGLPSMFLSIDGGRSWTSITASQGAHRRCVLALTVGAPRHPAPPPRDPTIDVSKR
jgi:hypothetical protein